MYEAPKAEARWALNAIPANIDYGRLDVLATVKTFARLVVGPSMRSIVTG